MDLAQDISVKTKIIQTDKEEYNIYVQFSKTVLKQFVYCLTVRMVAFDQKRSEIYIFIWQNKLFVWWFKFGYY